jgi:excisionase family DNA binding protein
MEKFYTLEQVAEMLGVNYQLIYRLVRSGDLPALKIGRIYRITQDGLDEYLKAQNTQSANRCAVCNREFRSRLSLKNRCGQCGAPICVDCFDRKQQHCCCECGTEGNASGFGDKKEGNDGTVQ